MSALVSREDDPLFDADHSRGPSGQERRAGITVAEVEQIADGSMWRCPPRCPAQAPEGRDHT